MRILLFTQWFPPEPQKLLFELAVTLKELGHDVTVLTGLPNYPTGKLYPGYRYRLWQRETMGGLSIIRVPLYPDHSRSGVRRALNFVSFSLAAALLGPFLIPRVDVIHVIHPPITMGLAAWTISRIRRVPFTYEIQDMWPETLAATGMVRQRWVLRLVGAFAQWVYSRSAGIRVISPGFRENLISKKVPADKIHTISNWVDPGFYAPAPRNEQLKEKLGFTNKFVVTYAGTIGPAQQIDTLVEAAALLNDVPDVLIAIFGEGLERESLTTKAAERGLTNVRFYGLWPATEMSSIYALTDVVLIHLKDDPLFRITIPHKTYVYMAVAKPVLAAVEGDVADVITSAGAGITCPPSQPRLLAAAIRRLRATPPEALAEMGRRGRSAAETIFERKTLVTQVSSLLEQAATDRPDRNRSR
jgi:putative colanic acid biosynthesis glycosyltransferase WcaI